jgi:hypothetical protein
MCSGDCTFYLECGGLQIWSLTTSGWHMDMTLVEVDASGCASSSALEFKFSSHSDNTWQDAFHIDGIKLVGHDIIQTTCEVSLDCVTATFDIYVRGQLDVTQINTSTSPTTGSPVTINATIGDNAGNLVANNSEDNVGSSTKPAVMAIVTGSGEYFEINLYDDATNGDVEANDGIWSGQFTPQKTGDHKIIVKAGDGHDKWTDGRGSKNIAVSGTFPYSFASGSSILTVIFMILLALKALMHLGYGQRVK